MSLPGATIEQLREHATARKVEADEWIRDLERALEIAKGKIETLELACTTLRRRVETLELERAEQK